MNRRQLKKAVKQMLDREQEIFDNMKTKSAPSGEWTEYNIEYTTQDNIVYALERVYDLFKKVPNDKP